MSTPTASEPTAKQRRVGPFTYEPRKRETRARGDHFPAKAAGGVGFAMAAAHEVVYRQTGGDDFLYDVISHAGADMLVLTALPIVAVLVVVGQRGRG